MTAPTASVPEGSAAPVTEPSTPSHPRSGDGGGSACLARTPEGRAKASAEQLLEVMLTASPYERALAWHELSSRGLSGSTVVDSACSADRIPAVLTVTQLVRHLRITESPAAISIRGGKRLHSVESVQFGALDDVEGRGPAFAQGSGRR